MYGVYSKINIYWKTKPSIGYLIHFLFQFTLELNQTRKLAGAAYANENDSFTHFLRYNHILVQTYSSCNVIGSKKKLQFIIVIYMTKTVRTWYVQKQGINCLYFNV